MWPFKRTVVINNNIGFPAPHIHHRHHHCGGFGGVGNFFNMMAGYSLATTMMSTALFPFRTQSYMPMMPSSYTPSYNPSNNYTPVANPMSDARKTLDSLGFTRQSGYSVSLGEDGNLTYTYTNGNDVINASNLKELLDKQAAAREAS